MFDFIQFGTQKLQLFLLVLLRTSGLFLLAPILSHRSIPNLAKAGLVIMLSLILVAVLDAASVPAVSSLAELAGVAFKELFVGATIGFVFMLVFWAVQGAGSVAGYQIGMYIANALDPTTQTQSSIIGQVWFLLGLLVFLSINGHHLVISAFADSYRVIPPGMVFWEGSVGEMVLRYTAYVFVIALKVGVEIALNPIAVDLDDGAVSPVGDDIPVAFGVIHNTLGTVEQVLGIDARRLQCHGEGSISDEQGDPSQRLEDGMFHTVLLSVRCDTCYFGQSNRSTEIQ